MYSFKQFLIETKEHIERLKRELSGRGISDEEINRLILDNPEDSIAGFYETGKSLFPSDSEADKALGDMILSRDQAAREKASKEEIARAEKTTTEAEKEESSKRGREQRASFEEQQKAAKARADADKAEAARAETGRRMAAGTQPSTTTPAPKKPTPQIEEPTKSGFRQAFDPFYNYGKGVKDETVNVLGDLKRSIPGMRKSPVSSLGKGAPFGGGIDLGIRMGMDFYDMYQDPQWQYKPSEWSDVVKSELKNIGYSALAGTAIGGIFGGPLGAGAGAVAGGLEAIATAPYGVASNVMKSGYEERGTVKALETRLKTTEQLKNASDPKFVPAYNAVIERNKKDLEDAKSNESMLSKFSKGVDAVVGLDIGLGRKGIPEPEPKTPTELRAAAEERFAERYPKGIPGGLAPGKSASQVEREAAGKITKEMETGSTPEQLAKKYGFEPEQEENERIASGGKTKAEVEFEKKLAVATERLKAERAERDRKAMERFEKSRYSL
jgi:hypothetical protein